MKFLSLILKPNDVFVAQLWKFYDLSCQNFSYKNSEKNSDHKNI